MLSYYIESIQSEKKPLKMENSYLEKFLSRKKLQMMTSESRVKNRDILGFYSRKHITWAVYQYHYSMYKTKDK